MGRKSQRWGPKGGSPKSGGRSQFRIGIVAAVQIVRLGFLGVILWEFRRLFGWTLALNRGHNSTRRLPERGERTKFAAGEGKKSAKWAPTLWFPFWAPPTLFGRHNPFCSSVVRGCSLGVPWVFLVVIGPSSRVCTEYHWPKWVILLST